MFGGDFLLGDSINGILVIDKPSDYTSFDVVAIMRGIFKQKKVGHAGTLDPMATGVLPILLGSATKAQNLMPDSNKEYIADFLLGIKTDTQDITGKILEKCSFSVTKERLKDVLAAFKGEIDQIPPMYSAVKKNGKRLYNLARSGLVVEREPRKVEIFALDLLNFDEITGKVSIKVYCSKGTYIRTLCFDIGNKLGCGATLTNLRRTQACGLNIEDSLTIDEVKKLNTDGILYEKILNVDELFEPYEKIKVSAAQAIRFNNGGSLLIERTELSDKLNLLDDNQIIGIYADDNKFLGLAFICLEEKALKVKRRF